MSLPIQYNLVAFHTNEHFDGSFEQRATDILQVLIMGVMISAPASIINSEGNTSNLMVVKREALKL